MTKVKYQRSEKETVLWQRYAWIGATLGLALGLFFRPARPPGLIGLLGLSFLAALVTVILQLFRDEERSLRKFLRQTAVNWLRYALFLGLLVVQTYAHEWGGRTATAVLGTVVGALLGVWYGYSRQGES